MKYTGLSVALLATSVAAASFEVRQVSVIQDVLDNVQSEITKVDSSVKAYNGGDSSALESAGKNLIDALAAGNSKAKAISELDLKGALGLTDPVTKLTGVSQTLVTDLKAKKSTIEKAGKCKTAQALVNNVNDSSNTLIATVVSKVPKDAQSVADSLVAKLKEVLNDATSAYKDCTDAAGSGSTSEKPTAGPTSAAGGSTEAPAPTSSAAGSYGPPPAVSSTPAATTPGAPEPTTSAPPAPTTGAAGALAPAGALALAFAAALL